MAAAIVVIAVLSIMSGVVLVVLVLLMFTVVSRHDPDEVRISLSTKISKAELSWKKHSKD